MGTLENGDLAVRAKIEPAQSTRFYINSRFSSAWQIILSFGGTQTVENRKALKSGIKIRQISACSMSARDFNGTGPFRFRGKGM